MTDREENRGSLFDPAGLQRLIDQLARTDVDEVEIVHGASRLYLRREPGNLAVGPVRGGRTERAQTTGVPVPAPLTGVYYSRATPDEPPFVTVGALVQRGQIVALIETMKLFNEVVSEVTGEVLSVAAAEGDLVEAGQPLMYLAPGDEEAS